MHGMLTAHAMATGYPGANGVASGGTSSMRANRMVAVMVTLLWLVAAAPAFACSCAAGLVRPTSGSTEAEEWRRGEAYRKGLIEQAGDSFRDGREILVFATVYRQELVEDAADPHYGGVRSFLRVEELWSGSFDREAVITIGGAGMAVTSCDWRLHIGDYRPLVLYRINDEIVVLAGHCSQVLARAIYRQGLLATVTGRREPLAKYAR